MFSNRYSHNTVDSYLEHISDLRIPTVSVVVSRSTREHHQSHWVGVKGVVITRHDEPFLCPGSSLATRHKYGGVVFRSTCEHRGPAMYDHVII